MKDIITLSIESSCDETAVAVLKNGREVLANVVSTQIELHKKFGGVVPEVASRKHIENIDAVYQEALDAAGIKPEEIDHIAVTYGPGLVGALLVGLSYAKALAFTLGVPIVGVNHMQGHINANYIQHKDLKPPFITLVVSGGHTHLVEVKDYQNYEILGRTRDDASGEAFDKISRAMGLGYPGGPIIDKLAKQGNKHAIEFPRAYLDDSYDFSFSGFKCSKNEKTRDSSRRCCCIFPRGSSRSIIYKSCQCSRRKRIQNNCLIWWCCCKLSTKRKDNTNGKRKRHRNKRSGKND